MKFSKLIKSTQATDRKSGIRLQPKHGKHAIRVLSLRSPVQTIEMLLLLSASADCTDLADVPDVPDFTDLAAELDKDSSGGWGQGSELTPALKTASAGEITNGTDSVRSDGLRIGITRTVTETLDTTYSFPATDNLDAELTETLMRPAGMEVVFIDRATPDYQAMVSDLMRNLSPDRDIEVILLDSDRGIDQIGDFLSLLKNVAAIHIVSHGSSGLIELGNESLTLQNFDEHIDSFASWSNVMTDDADILIYGCDLAANGEGRSLVASLAAVTNADVVASDDLTGFQELGGDWDLEYRVGSVETDIVFSNELQQNWEHVLVNLTGTAGSDILVGTSGADTIDGAGGNDMIMGGPDVLGTPGDFNSGSAATENAVTGTNSGWTVTQNDVDFLANGFSSMTVPGGGRAVDLNGSSGPGAIQTTLTTVVGNQYTVAFFLGGNGSGDFSLDVAAGGSSSSATATMPGGNGYSNMDWQVRAFTFTATSGTTTLSFTSTSGTTNDGPIIAGVRMVNNSASSGDDLLSGGTGDDVVVGAGGNDTIYGNAGSDRLYGGDGSDQFYLNSDGDAASDIIDGGDGADTYTFSASGDIASAALDNVRDSGGSGTDTIQFQVAAASTFMIEENFSKAVTGIDQFWDYYGGGFGSILGVATHATSVNWDFTGITFWPGISYIQGGSADDIITGSDGNDTIRGNGGNDTLSGGVGNDTIYGDAGSDLLYGGDGSDQFYLNSDGDAASDIIDGGDGADTYTFSASGDIASAALDNVRDSGGSGTDTIQFNVAAASTFMIEENFSKAVTGIDQFWDYYGGGFGSILGVATHATSVNWDFTGITFGTGISYIQGGNADDIITGSDGADTIHGNGGNDTLSGGAGNDTIYGDAGSTDYVRRVGNFATYTINRASYPTSISVSGGIEGTDTIDGNAEFLYFNDGVYNIASGAMASPPVISGVEGSALSYLENAAATALTSTLTLSDPDSANLTSATVQVTGNYQNGQDVLSFANTAFITGTWNAVTGTLTLSGTTTVANYQAALRAVMYANTSETPTTSIRTVSFSVTDGTLVSTVATRDISVTAQNDTPVGLPAVTGTVTENQTLTADTGALSDADGLGAFSYQWLRNGVAISGATSSTYTLGDADVGTQIRVQVSYVDGQGTAEDITSAATIAVANVNDVPVGAPGIIGTVTENQTLTADTSGISDADGLGAFGYQWLRNGVAISGATGSTYTLGDADVATQISVRVGYVDGNGTAESLTSTQTPGVTNVNDSPVGTPSVTGTATENQTLTANTSGITDADGLGTFSYQWLRNGAAVSGATGSTYTLGDADVATQISVQVSYVDGNGTPESLTSAQTAAVVNVNDLPIGVPAITGIVTENQTLTADTSGVSDGDGLGTFSYQWLRNGAAISGATGSTYTLGDADVATQISLQVNYVDGNGTLETTTSAATIAVANVNDAPAGIPAIVGTVVEDQTLTADTTGISDADGLGAFSYQWLRNGVAISGATGSTYTLVDADVAAQIRVQVGFVDGQGAAESITSAATAAVANVNDVPIGVPAITGTVTENQTLTADTSGISDADGVGTFSYQWLRNGVAISGATSSTYTLGDADVATQISVQTNYTDGNGTAEQLTSSQTSAVANVNDVSVGIPLIIGTVTENQTLTADTSGISDADGVGTFSYQWLRNGVAISGATSSTYTLGDADVGTQIRLQVSYADSQGTAESVTSAATAAVANVNDAPVGAPAIIGTVTENQTLIADTSGISDNDGLGSFSYQWLRNGVAISGATGSTYTLGDSDVATQISVRVSYVDGNGTAEQLTSAQTPAVANVNDTPVGTPSTTGTVEENQTLTADISGITDADGIGTFSYQWLRNGVAMSGATGSTYTLSNADVATQISVQVSYVDGNGTTESLTSAQTPAVTNVNDSPVGTPSVTGTVTENQTLSADTSGITDADGLGTFSYQWLRNGAAIAGATGGTFTLSDADVTTQISVQVSYVDGNGTAEQLTSTTTAAVVNVNDVAVGLPTINGTVTENQTLTANTSGVSDADGLGTISYQWLRNGAAISGATNSTYTLADVDVATQISVRVSYVDANGTAEQLTSAQTAAVANVNDVPVGLPTINGTAAENQTLTANTSGISDADGLGTFSYQWLRNGATISGATGSTYTLSDADVATQISVRVSYIDAQSTAESVTSAATVPVANINDAPTISSIGNHVFDVSVGSGVIGFTVADNDNAPASLTLQVTSSDESVVPSSSILLGGTGGNRTIEILTGLSPAAGSATITVTVSDGIASSSTSFVVTTLSDSSNGVIYAETGGGASRTSSTENRNTDATSQSNSTDAENTNGAKANNKEDDILSRGIATQEIVNFSDGLRTNAIVGSDNMPSVTDRIDQLLAQISRDLSKITNEQSQEVIRVDVADRGESAPSDEMLLTEEMLEEVVPQDEYQLVSISDVPLQLDAPTEDMEFDPEAAAEEAEETAQLECAGSATLTTVIAAGAMSAISKGTAVGVLGLNTTTNNFVHIASNGKRVAVRTFEALVTQLSQTTGKLTAEALACEQIRSSGIVSGAELSLQTILAATASSVPLWCSFDPLVILDRFASEYGTPDAAEQRSLASMVVPTKQDSL